MQRDLKWLWFVLGFGSQLQVIASLSLTELFVLCSAPFVLLKNYNQMRRDGIGVFWGLSVMVVVGCWIGVLANDTPFRFALRGYAVTIIMSCSIIFSHWLIRKAANGFKWYIVGTAISLLVCTFVFQKSIELNSGVGGVEDVMAGTLYWKSRVTNWLVLPVRAWYLHVPSAVSIMIPVCAAVFSMVITASGRGTALGLLGFAAMVAIGGRKVKTMSRISRHFVVFCIGGILVVLLAHASYRIAATKGWLGEESYKKYVGQTQGEKGIMRLLIGGRGDSFIGLLACRDKPIIGWGPWARDENGYAEEFISKYGTISDVQDLMRRRAQLSSWRLLSCHSVLTEFWAWYGISGLLFVLYILFVVIRFLKHDVAAVPQWFGWLACGVPGMLWNFFFNPLAERFGLPLFVVACLMARAVRKGSFRLPIDMLREIAKAERS